MMLSLASWALYLTVVAVGIVKSSEGKFLAATVALWKDDARLFVRECIGVIPDKWQDEALRLASDPKTRRIALKACKGPGKTAVLAWIILWFLCCHPNSKVAATSLTEANINTNLWPELYKWIDSSPLLGGMFIWTKVRVSRRGRAGANWFAEKRTWPKTGDSQQQADALAGVHADDVLFVLDESGGIPQAVMVTAEAVLANLTEAMEAAGHRAMVIQAGNPTHTSGPLHRACTTERHLWHVITITGDPDDPMRSPRISLQHAREQIALWGRDNPWVMVNILGMFPPASINALLGVEEVEAAMKRHYTADDYGFSQKRLGVDVARFGDDRTVLFPRQGLAAFRPEVLRVARTTTIAARVARANSLWHPEIIFVDDTGHWGHGVIDNLLTANIPVIPINYAEPSIDKRYKTTRDLMWMEMAKWVKAGGALPHIPALIRELTEPTYTFIGGKFVVEPKDQIKARLGESPDLADALAETFALPEMPGQTLEELLKGRAKKGGDWNPYESREVDLEQQLDEIGRHAHEWDPFASRD
jgi:hypothetical protein